MKNIIERQATLIRRADVLLQILFDRCQPELTEEEKKWFSELKHLSSIITKKHKPHIIQVNFFFIKYIYIYIITNKNFYYYNYYFTNIYILLLL